VKWVERVLSSISFNGTGGGGATNTCSTRDAPSFFETLLFPEQTRDFRDLTKDIWLDCMSVFAKMLSSLAPAMRWCGFNPSSFASWLKTIGGLIRIDLYAQRFLHQRTETRFGMASQSFRAATVLGIRVRAVPRHALEDGEWPFLASLADYTRQPATPRRTPLDWPLVAMGLQDRRQANRQFLLK